MESVTIAQVDEHSKPIPGTEEEILCDTLLLFHLAGGKAVALEACDHRVTALDKDGALAADAADAEGHVGALFHAFQTDALRQGVAKVCAGLHGQHTSLGYGAVLDVVGSRRTGQLALAGNKVHQIVHMQHVAAGKHAGNAGLHVLLDRAPVDEVTIEIEEA